jgi:alpha-D-ribose 1-methylphosphonate 5-triphosphate diphosphatase
MPTTLLTNARIVQPDRVFDGSLVIEDDLIAEILDDPNPMLRDGVDCGGQWLIPGVIDTHTDYIEKEIAPRPSSEFPIELAFHFMDIRAISSGLTTVLGAIRVSEDRLKNGTLWRRDGLAMAAEYERLAPDSLARHYLHVRWDPNFEPADEAIQRLSSFSRVGNIVYNENIPGQRQFRDLEEIARKQAERQGITREEAIAHLNERIERNSKLNNRTAGKAAFEGKITIGSHDDTTVEHVIEAHAAGATLSEMPTTLEAARKARELGMWVTMGAPNYYRGGSHCGNLSCHEALAEGLVDILCSDYHFPSLLGCLVKLIQAGDPVSHAVNLMTLNPARSLGWGDRLGSIEEGKIADLVLFRPQTSYGFVTRVWIDGECHFDCGKVRAQDAVFA